MCPNDGKLPNTEDWFWRSGLIAVSIPYYIVQKTLELVCTRSLERLATEAREVLECCKQRLVDNSDQSSGDPNIDKNGNSKGQA